MYGSGHVLSSIQSWSPSHGNESVGDRCLSEPQAKMCHRGWHQCALLTSRALRWLQLRKHLFRVQIRCCPSTAGTVWEMTTGSGDRKVERKCPLPSCTPQVFKSLQPIFPGGKLGPDSPSPWIGWRVPHARSQAPWGRDRASTAGLILLQQEGMWHLISSPTAGSIKSIFFVVQTE